MDIKANGAAIRAIRKAQGVPQVSLAKRAGITNAYLCAIEYDRRQNVSLDVLRALAEGLGVPLGTITYRTPELDGVAS